VTVQWQGGWHAIRILSTSKTFYEHHRLGLIHTQPTSVWEPPTDVYECEDLYAIKVAISGLKKSASGDLEDAEVLVEDDTIVVRGHRRDYCPLKKYAIHQMEIHYGPFEVRVRIYAPFDRDRVTATYSDGFLEVLVPKAARTLPGRHRIAIRR